MPNTEYFTLNFYGWWQAITCLFAFLALLAIWWHLGRLKKDYAQLWLAFSILCWSITGFTEVFFSRSMLSAGSDPALLQTMQFKMGGYSSLLSLCNSFFILLALPWFRYIPKRIKPIVKSRYWNVIVGLPFLFSVLPTLSRIFLSSSSYSVISELDLYYSIFTLTFLGLVLWESFARRRLKLLAWLSLICILITFTAQVLKVSGNEIDMRLFSAIFKTTLIMMFFALAMSWVKDLSENIMPSANDLFLSLSGNEVTLSGIAGKDAVSFSITNAPSELLRSFADSKLKNDSWLEIKPKSERKTGKVYPIKDHNEVKRLTHALLDGVYGKNSWSREQHEMPFKQSFYETSKESARKIRLRMPEKNIVVN